MKAIRIKTTIVLSVCAMLTILLAACTKKPPPPITYTYQTKEQLHHNYFRTLIGAGVQVIHVGQTITLVFPSDQVFIYNSANLQSNYKYVLLTAARYIQYYKIQTVEVAGYSDNVKRSRAPDHKRLLTEKQAQILARYLWEHKIHASFIYSRGHGHHHPIALNQKSSAGRSLNRRVEVTFRYYPVKN